VEYNVEPWKSIFYSFHNCSGEPKVIHGNGDSLISVYK
jgi:hypothetical protein